MFGNLIFGKGGFGGFDFGLGSPHTSHLCLSFPFSKVHILHAHFSPKRKKLFYPINFYQQSYTGCRGGSSSKLKEGQPEKGAAKG